MIKIPHLGTEREHNLTHIIEDDLKLKCELLYNHEPEKLEGENAWKAYRGFVVWVAVCKTLNRQIGNEDHVQGIMEELWAKVQKWDKYQAEIKQNCMVCWYD